MNRFYFWITPVCYFKFYPEDNKWCCNVWDTRGSIKDTTVCKSTLSEFKFVAWISAVALISRRIGGAK